MQFKSIFIKSLLIICIGGIAYMLFNKLEKVEETIEVGFMGEARSNPLYASRLFLKRMGIAAQRVELYQLDHLPNINTVIVIDTYRYKLSKSRIIQLLAWVKRGGHLLSIVVPDRLTEDRPDQLQAQLAISIDQVQHFIANNQQQEVYLPSVKRTYTLDLKQINVMHLQLNQQTDQLIHLQEQPFLLHRNYGEGLISLISSLDFAHNSNLELADHAEFLWQILHRLHTQPDTIWLLNSEAMPALWQWLWQAAWQLTLTLSLILALYLYALSHRMGPILDIPVLNRRRILEHIQASGYFFWKTKQQHHLIDSSRMAVLKQLAVHFPTWLRLTQTQQLHLLSQHIHFSTAQLQQILFSPKHYSSHEFTQLIQQLNSIYRKFK
jgi:hypothetical protein